MNWDLTQVLCDGFCGPRYEHHLLRMGIGAGCGLVTLILTKKANWQSILLCTGIVAGIHAISAIPKYGLDLPDHLSDAAYTAIGAAQIPIWKSNKKVLGTGISVSVYIAAYPHSSP